MTKAGKVKKMSKTSERLARSEPPEASAKQSERGAAAGEDLPPAPADTPTDWEDDPRVTSLLLRVADLTLRALVQTALLHGRPLYNEAARLGGEVQAALGAGDGTEERGYDDLEISRRA